MLVKSPLSIEIEAKRLINESYCKQNRYEIESAVGLKTSDYSFSLLQSIGESAPN